MAAIFWQHQVVNWPTPNFLNNNWSCCLERFYICKLYVDWNSFDQSNEGRKEHIMYIVFAISLWRANQIILFHVFQFSGITTCCFLLSPYCNHFRSVPPASPTFAGPRSRKSRAQCGLSNSGLRLNPEANVKVTVAESSVSVIANKFYDVPSPPLVSFLIGLNR